MAVEPNITEFTKEDLKNSLRWLNEDLKIDIDTNIELTVLVAESKVANKKMELAYQERALTKHNKHLQTAKELLAEIQRRRAAR